MGKKGILDIEFILSVFVFVSTVSFVVIVVVLSNIPVLQQFSASEDRISRSYQISEKLLFTEGSPENWDENTVTSLGLSSGGIYVMNMNKINNLSSLCDKNYNRIKELLGLGYGNNIIINITYTNSSKIIFCGPKFISKSAEARIDRIGIVNYKPVRVSVSIS